MTTPQAQLTLLDDLLVGASTFTDDSTSSELAILSELRLIYLKRQAFQNLERRELDPPPAATSTEKSEPTEKLPPIKGKKPKKLTVKDVPCSACGAKKGQWCVSKTGKELSSASYHTPRRDLWRKKGGTQ